MNACATATTTQCPVCAAADTHVFWEAPDVPVHCNVLCATREQALQVPRGDMRLAFCRGCGLMRNLAFDPGRVAYDAGYENSLHFSPRFQQYAQELAGRLVDRHGLRGKTVLEIACGQGDFLRLLCDLGNNRGFGFDPSFDPVATEATESDRVTVVAEPYSARQSGHPADLICCRHALEHMADPVAFLRMIRRNIGKRTDTTVFFEVPNGLFTLRHRGIWDLIYEHCTYFVPESLRRCFEAGGFDVLNVREEFDGQFLTIEAAPNAGGDQAAGDGDQDGGRLARDVGAFGDRYRSTVDAWRRRMNAFREAGRRVVVWGSGSKGVTFLNVLCPGDVIEYVVDINPRKQGRFVAGTGQRIVAADFLRAYRPHTVIVMNPIYLDEIRSAAQAMGITGECCVA